MDNETKLLLKNLASGQKLENILTDTIITNIMNEIFIDSCYDSQFVRESQREGKSLSKILIDDIEYEIYIRVQNEYNNWTDSNDEKNSLKKCKKILSNAKKILIELKKYA